MTRRSGASESDAGCLLVVANTESRHLELHRRDRRYVPRIAAKNRHDFYDTEEAATALYERSELPEVLIDLMVERDMTGATIVFAASTLNSHPEPPTPAGAEQPEAAPKGASKAGSYAQR